MLRWAAVPALSFVVAFGVSLLHFASDDDEGARRAAAAVPGEGRLVVTYTPTLDDADHGYLGSLRLDGSDERRLADTPGVDELSPAWSPDGRRIALLGDSLVAMVDAGGGAPRPLTPRGEAKESRPSWSPTGTRLAFTRDPGKILTMDPEGSHVRQTPFDRSANGVDWVPGG